MPNQPFTPPLYHDRAPSADWGWIKDQTGALIYIARDFSSEKELAAHREKGTDPAQARVDALLQAFRDVEDLQKRLRAIRADMACLNEEWVERQSEGFQLMIANITKLSTIP